MLAARLMLASLSLLLTGLSLLALLLVLTLWVVLALLTLLLMLALLFMQTLRVVLTLLLMLALLFVLRRFVPKLPAALLVVVAAIALSWGFDFAAHGVAEVGKIPAGLPSFEIPSPSFSQIVQLAPAAVGIFLDRKSVV